VTTHDVVGGNRHIVLFVFVVVSALVWWRPLITNLELAMTSDAHTHIILIPPLSISLIYLKRKELGAVSKYGGWSGLVFLAAALLLRLFTISSRGDLSSGNQLSLNVFAFVIWCLGAVLLCCGLRALQTILFPLCLLFLFVPPPEQLLAATIGFLQHSSAWASSMLFRLAKVPVVRDGIILSIPGLDIEVAQECSSIRSSMMLMITTLVVAYLSLNSWWRRCLLIAAAVPLSVAKNAVRIFTIAELGTRVDPGYLDGRLHHNGGVVFLSLAIIAVLAIVWLLRKNELKRTIATPQEMGTD